MPEDDFLLRLVFGRDDDTAPEDADDADDDADDEDDEDEDDEDAPEGDQEPGPS
jgi:hypothetical protein